MNKKKYYSIFFIALFLSILPQCKLAAQEQQTEDTHAHSESHKWKGIDVNTVLNNPEYATNGKEIYLFNIGTGRFIIEGGNFGMEGRLFHEDFGRPLYLMYNSQNSQQQQPSGFIKSGITKIQMKSRGLVAMPQVLSIRVPGLNGTNTVIPL